MRFFRTKTVLFSLAFFCLFFQVPYRVWGQSYSIQPQSNWGLRQGSPSVGLGLTPLTVIPLFYFNYNGDQGFTRTQLQTGWLGWLHFMYFFSDNAALGAQLKYDFIPDINYSLNFLYPENNRGDYLVIVPITLKYQHYFNLAYRWAWYFVGNVGIAFMGYGEEISGTNTRHFDMVPALSVGSGISYDVNDYFSISLQGEFWSYIELSSGSTPAFIGEFLDIGIVFSANIPTNANSEGR